MKDYLLQTKQFLPIPLDKAWEFFSSPNNLSKIAPSAINFKILTGYGNGEIYNGMKIKYKVSPLLAIPLNWETEIDRVNYQVSFADKQIKGAYKKWEHIHTY